MGFWQLHLAFCNKRNFADPLHLPQQAPSNVCHQRTQQSQRQSQHSDPELDAKHHKLNSSQCLNSLSQKSHLNSLHIACVWRGYRCLKVKTFYCHKNRIEKVETSFNSLFDTGRDVTLDQLGELVVSEKEADHYRDEVIKLIEGFGKYVKKGVLAA